MNSYEEKKQRRIDYYNEKAEKFEQESSRLAHESSKMVEAIPMGQPLMPDHYSYKSDKNYRDRAWGKMEKSVEAGQKADYYRSKAEAAENNSAISSDDPEAVTKLKEKLQQRQEQQSYMKKVNAYYRKNGTMKGFEGISDEKAAEIDEEVRRIMEDAYAKCEKILTDHRDQLECLAQYLLKYEKIDGEDFEKLMHGELVTPPDAPEEDKPDFRSVVKMLAMNFRYALPVMVLYAPASSGR